MSEITGKLLGILATIAVFIVAIMVAVYPNIESQGETVGDEIEGITNNMPSNTEISW